MVLRDQSPGAPSKAHPFDWPPGTIHRWCAEKLESLLLAAETLALAYSSANAAIEKCNKAKAVNALIEIEKSMHEVARAMPDKETRAMLAAVKEAKEDYARRPGFAMELLEDQGFWRATCTRIYVLAEAMAAWMQEFGDENLRWHSTVHLWQTRKKLQVFQPLVDEIARASKIAEAIVNGRSKSKKTRREQKDENAAKYQGLADPFFRDDPSKSVRAIARDIVNGPLRGQFTTPQARNHAADRIRKLIKRPKNL